MKHHPLHTYVCTHTLGILNHLTLIAHTDYYSGGLCHRCLLNLTETEAQTMPPHNEDAHENCLAQFQFSQFPIIQSLSKLTHVYYFEIVFQIVMVKTR